MIRLDLREAWGTYQARQICFSLYLLAWTENQLSIDDTGLTDFNED
jgi:hypothetical protein